MYNMFIHVRSFAHDAGDKHLFCIADIVHNVPLQILQALQGVGAYDGILAWMRDRAQMRSCGDWFERAVEAAIGDA